MLKNVYIARLHTVKFRILWANAFEIIDWQHKSKRFLYELRKDQQLVIKSVEMVKDIIDVDWQLHFLYLICVLICPYRCQICDLNMVTEEHPFFSYCQCIFNRIPQTLYARALIFVDCNVHM